MAREREREREVRRGMRRWVEGNERRVNRLREMRMKRARQERRDDGKRKGKGDRE